MEMFREIKEHLIYNLIPFWKSLRDDTYGGFYGRVDSSGKVYPDAEKSCIVNSRILWFFSSCLEVLGDSKYRTLADHAYDYVKKYCVDCEQGV